MYNTHLWLSKQFYGKKTVCVIYKVLQYLKKTIAVHWSTLYSEHNMLKSIIIICINKYI